MHCIEKDQQKTYLPHNAKGMDSKNKPHNMPLPIQQLMDEDPMLTLRSVSLKDPMVVTYELEHYEPERKINKSLLQRLISKIASPSSISSITPSVFWVVVTLTGHSREKDIQKFRTLSETAGDGATRQSIHLHGSRGYVGFR
jgi:hypothetical protein